MAKIWTASVTIEIYQYEDEDDETFEERVDETIGYVSDHVDRFKILDSQAW